jgi:hypothetical protein
LQVVTGLAHQAGGRLRLELQDKTWVAVEDVDVYTTAPG